MSKPLISVIVPVYNESENIPNVVKRVAEVLERIRAYDYEILFTDNHSEDNSFEIISNLSKKNKKIKSVRFSKNFGYQKSIYTGYLLAKGDVVVQLDADLQDPPELLPKMIELWKAGNDVVYGIRKSRKEGFLIHSFRRLFYRIINWLSDDELPVDVGDFRLVDKRVIDNVLRKSNDATPYIRGLIAASGFNQVGFEYARDERRFGETKFNVKQLFQLAFDGIVNHSIKPLRIANAVAGFTTFVVIIASSIYFIGKVFLGMDWPAGFATQTILILIGILFNAFFLGIIGEYLGRIYLQTKKRPFVIVQDSVNMSKADVGRHEI